MKSDGIGRNQTESDGIGWNRTISNGIGRNRTESDGIKRNRTESYGIKRNRRNRTQSDAIKRNQMQSYGIEQNQTASEGIGRNRTESDGIGRNQTESDGIGRNRTESDGIGWNRTESDEIKSNRARGRTTRVHHNKKLACNVCNAASSLPPPGANPIAWKQLPHRNCCVGIPPVWKALNSRHPQITNKMLGALFCFDWKYLPLRKRLRGKPSRPRTNCLEHPPACSVTHLVLDTTAALCSGLSCKHCCVACAWRGATWPCVRRVSVQHVGGVVCRVTDKDWRCSLCICIHIAARFQTLRSDRPRKHFARPHNNQRNPSESTRI